jgi:2,4-dienoyl-CoA reductase-like NADH-dependent reductase (Old Yellow Enzyme family)
MSYEHVSQPLTIGPISVKNRILRPSHVTGFNDGTITDQNVAYQTARARGGFGLIVLEYAAVHPSCVNDIHAFSDAPMSGWTRMAEQLHASDCRLFQQLWHGGIQGHGGRNPASRVNAAAGPPWGPSAVPNMSGQLAQPMSKDMIQDVVTGFAHAARRCRDAGLDGVEIQAGHGYLLCQFLSPMTNRRTDEYGGTLENRLRFTREVLTAVRAEVGNDIAVGVRISATEAIAGGLDVDDSRQAAVSLEAAGLVDFVNVSIGGDRFPLLIGTSDLPAGYQLPTSEPVTRAVAVPTMVVGRFTSLDQCESVVASGAADMVGMVRAAIADPEVVNKSLAGRASEVRPCLGFNEGCLGKRGLVRLTCAVNVHVGEEGTDRYPPADSPRSVLVVGAGPAGLHAAHAAALCGHNVTLVEAGTEAGGALQLARRAPLRNDIGKIVDWLLDGLERLHVPIRLSVRADVEFVEREAPDVVICATGAIPRRDAIQRSAPAVTVSGLEADHVLTISDLMRRDEVRKRSALIFDDAGSYAGIGAADYLLTAGAQVLYATSFGMLTPNLTVTGEQERAALRLGSNPAFTLMPRMTLTDIRDGAVVLRGLDTGRDETVDAELVVLGFGGTPDRGLHDALADLSVDRVLVGDALTADDLQHAMSSGYRAGVSLSAGHRRHQLA